MMRLSTDHCEKGLPQNCLSGSGSSIRYIPGKYFEQDGETFRYLLNAILFVLIVNARQTKSNIYIISFIFLQMLE